MKNEILNKLSEIVINLDGNNYKEGFSRIKDLLGQLRGIMDPATLDEVCEVFGDDYTVREILTNYFNSGETSLLEGLESYLSSSVTALDSNLDEEAEEMHSTFTTEFPNIINTEELENMDKEASIKNVEITKDGMVKALVELPAAEAAKVLTEVAHNESLGSSVADELAKVVIAGDPNADLADPLKPVEGKVIQIIDTRSDIVPAECFSVAKIKTYNKYMYQFSEATDPLLSEIPVATEEECGLEASLEAPEEIPVKSTVVETNSALPTVEDVAEVAQPVSYVDSEMVAPGENEAVDALGEITGALSGLEAEQASEALGLIAEQIGPESAEAIQGEMLSKANPEVFSSFSKNSWITDQEVFAAYNVLANYFGGNITNFSTESGSALKERFLANFASAVELVNNSIGSAAAKRFTGISTNNRLLNHVEDIYGALNKVSKRTAEFKHLADEKAKLLEFLKNNGSATADEIAAAQNEFDNAISMFTYYAEKEGLSNAGQQAMKMGLWDSIKEHPVKSGLIGAGAVSAGGLGGVAVGKATSPVQGVDEFEGFSSKDEYYFSESSDVMEEAVEKLVDAESLEASAELLSEVAERVSPEVALALQAEMCKENSSAAKELADNAIVDEEEVAEALAVIEDALENGVQETFSDAKRVYFHEIMGNFADIAEDAAEGELVNLEESEEAEEDDEDIEFETESKEMDEVVKKFESLPSIEDAATLLVEIEDKVGPEAALAVQSEILKDNSDLFKDINDQIVMDDDVVKEIYSIVNGFAPESEMNFSEAGMDRYHVYVRNFAEALSDEEKASIVEEVKAQIMGEMAGAPAPMPAPVPALEGEMVPPPPPAVPEEMPAPAPEGMPVPPPMPEGVPPVPPVEAPVPPMPAPEAAPVVPPAPAMPVDVPVAPEAVPAPAVAPEMPVPAEAPVMPPPGMAAAPQAPVNVELPGQQIMPGAAAPIDVASVERPDIAPVVPGLIAESIPPPAPYATEEGVAEVPPMPMEMPSEAVVTSTTGNFTPSAVNAPKYVHLVQQSPMEQMQATMPPVEPAVGNPQMPPMEQMSDVEVQKAIVDNFSRARRQVSFSSTKESDIEEYKRTMLGY